MYKMLVLIRRKPGLSREEFRAYYEEHHAPWGIELLGTSLRRYVRNYVTGGTDDGPDVVTEFWWNTREDFEAFLKLRENSDIGRLLREDEEQFMDFGTVQLLIVDEVEQLQPVKARA